MVEPSRKKQGNSKKERERERAKGRRSEGLREKEGRGVKDPGVARGVGSHPLRSGEEPFAFNVSVSSPGVKGAQPQGSREEGRPPDPLEVEVPTRGPRR